MPEPPLRIHALAALPCRHDIAGMPHPTLSSAYRCIARYGLPGLRLTEVRPVPYGRAPEEGTDGP